MVRSGKFGFVFFPLISFFLLFLINSFLVACPSHLVAQWQEEIAKHTNPPLNVRTFTTLEDLKVTTYKDVIEAGMAPFLSLCLFILFFS